MGHTMETTVAIKTLLTLDTYVNASSIITCPPKEFSQRTRYLAEVICYIGLTTPICLLGILTNIVNCIVFAHQGLQDRMNLCLFSLACVDCLYLISAFILVSVISFLRFFWRGSEGRILFEIQPCSWRGCVWVEGHLWVFQYGHRCWEMHLCCVTTPCILPNTD